VSRIQPQSTPEDPGGYLSPSSLTRFHSGFCCSVDRCPVLSDEGLLGENYGFLNVSPLGLPESHFRSHLPSWKPVLLSGPSVSDCGHVFIYYCWGVLFCLMKKTFLGRQFTHWSLPSQVSQLWQLMLGGLGLCPQGCH